MVRSEQPATFGRPSAQSVHAQPDDGGTHEHELGRTTVEAAFSRLTLLREQALGMRNYTLAHALQQQLLVLRSQVKHVRFEQASASRDTRLADV